MPRSLFRALPLGTPRASAVPIMVVVGISVVAAMLLPHAAAAADLESVAWLAGRWELRSEGRHVEEVWLPPAGGLLLGMSREVREGKKTLFENLRIEERADGVFYVASPQGGPTTDFRLVKSEARRAIFENPTHDFPQRIEYWMDGEQLAAKISSLDETSASEWRYQRTP